MNTRHLDNKLVFSGPDAVLGFLHPDAPAPLVELPEELNPFHKDRVRIFAKLFANTWNSKAVAAFGMLEDALERGMLEGKHTIVESSSGNMALWLCIFVEALRKRYGIRDVVPVIPFDVAPAKIEILRLHGVKNPIFYEGDDGIRTARQMASEKKGYIHLNQYANEANPAAHERWTGPQILEQMRNIGCDMTIFCAGLGTTGTIVGVSRSLRRELGKENVRVIGVVCAKDNAVPGVRSEERLKEVSIDWKPWVDDIQYVGAMGSRGAYAASLQMFTRGIPGGPSSGFALRGLLDFLGGEKAADRLDMHRNRNGEVTAVFVCPDGHNPYLDKYSMALESKAIGKVGICKE